MDKYLSFQALARALRATLAAMPPGLLVLSIFLHAVFLTIIIRFLPIAENVTSPEIMQKLLSQLLEDLALVLLLYTAIIPFMSAMIFAAVRMVWLGASVSLKMLLHDTVRVWPMAMLMYFILEFIYVFSFQYLFVVPAIILMALFYPVLPRVVLERETPVQALREGFALTKGKRFQLVGLMTAFLVLYLFVLFSSSLLATPLLVADGAILRWLGALLMGVSMAASLTLGDVVKGLIYQYLKAVYSPSRP